MTPQEQKDAADAITASVEQTLTELGVALHWPEVVRAAQRAVLVVRERQGYDEGSPDACVGPPLTVDEQRAVLTRALRRLDR